MWRLYVNRYFRGLSLVSDNSMSTVSPSTSLLITVGSAVFLSTSFRSRAASAAYLRHFLIEIPFGRRGLNGFPFSPFK